MNKEEEGRPEKKSLGDETSPLLALAEEALALKEKEHWNWQWQPYIENRSKRSSNNP